jgi:4-hydroxy-3-methylbut-2-enyl diphosphate reductase
MADMDILTAKHAGFCEGVSRAYQIASDQAAQGRPVFMLGNLVHNKQVVEKLKNQGIKSVSSLVEIPDEAQGILLISAHGVSPEVYTLAEQKKLEIIDTTCPWVKRAQKVAKELAEEGRTVIILGDHGHPEVKAIVGWSDGRALVVSSLEELKKLKIKEDQRIGLIAQTTQPEEKFNQLASYLQDNYREVKKLNTICGATAKRQQAAVELAKQTELMLVVGDRLSANTKRLAELCAATGTETHQIETAEELDPGWLAGKDRIGLTAGASTPEWLIRQVEEKLRPASTRPANPF